MKEGGAAITGEPLGVNLGGAVHTHVIVLRPGTTRPGHQIALILLGPPRIALPPAWHHDLKDSDFIFFHTLFDQIVWFSQSINIFTNRIAGRYQTKGPFTPSVSVNAEISLDHARN